MVRCGGSQAPRNYLIPPTPRPPIGPASLCLHALEGLHSSHDIDLAKPATRLSNLAHVAHSPPSIGPSCPPRLFIRILCLDPRAHTSFLLPRRSRSTKIYTSVPARRLRISALALRSLVLIGVTVFVLRMPRPATSVR